MQSRFSGGFAVEGEFYGRNKRTEPATRAAIVTKRGPVVAIPGRPVAKGGGARAAGDDQQAVDHTPQNENAGRW